MLQKFSKCEVKAACEELKFYDMPATQILREIKFWWIQMVKNAIFGNFTGSEY